MRLRSARSGRKEKTMPKFSIIVPAYDSEGYISKALMSILDQTYRDYELIVVCDSCTDNTDEVAAAYGAKVFYIEAGSDGAAHGYKENLDLDYTIDFTALMAGFMSML